MKVGDLVWMPSFCSTKSATVGIVLRTKPDGIHRGTPRIPRVKVLWTQHADVSWEPAEWLEVMSEG